MIILKDVKDVFLVLKISILHTADVLTFKGTFQHFRKDTKFGL